MASGKFQGCRFVDKGAGSLARRGQQQVGATGQGKMRRTEGQVNQELPERGQEMRDTREERKQLDVDSGGTATVFMHSERNKNKVKQTESK